MKTIIRDDTVVIHVAIMAATGIIVMIIMIASEVNDNDLPRHMVDIWRASLW